MVRVVELITLNSLIDLGQNDSDTLYRLVCLLLQFINGAHVNRITLFIIYDS